MTKDIEDLISSWEEAKGDEREAMERRRQIEDEIAAFVSLEEKPGTTTINDRLVIRQSVTRKIDPQKVAEVAAEKSIDVSEVFRVKLDLVKTAWDKLPESTRRDLSVGIEEKIGRPTFEMKKKKETKK